MIRTIDGIKPCPKCGKHPVSVRHMGFDAARRAGLKPYAVCCGVRGVAIMSWEILRRKLLKRGMRRL